MKFILEIDEEKQLSRDEFRILVIAKAGYKCERCFKKVEELEKISYERGGKILKRGFLQSHHKDRNKENNKLSNGICLCVTCHNKEHEEESRRALIERNNKGQAKKASKIGWDKINSMNEKDRKEYLSARASKTWRVRKERYGPSGGNKKGRRK